MEVSKELNIDSLDWCNYMNHLGTIELITDRLILRQMKEEDAKGIFDSFVNNEKFLYYANKEKRTLDQEIESLYGIEEKYKNKEYYNWLITLLDGEIIGSINLHVDNENDLVWFNYAIDDRHYNHGYMTEALNAIKVFALENLKVSKIIGGCEVDNIASQKVMEKCGFKLEEIRKNELKLKDGFHDLKIYSIIN